MANKKKINWSKLESLGGYVIAGMDIKGATQAAWKWAERCSPRERAAYGIGSAVLAAVLWIAAGIADLNPTYQTVNSAITSGGAWIPASIAEWRVPIAILVTLSPMIVEFVLSRMATENIGKTRPVLAACVLFDFATDVSLALVLTSAVLSSACGSLILGPGSACGLVGAGLLSRIMFSLAYAITLVLVLFVCSFYLEAAAIIVTLTTAFLAYQSLMGVPSSLMAARQRRQGRSPQQDSGRGQPPRRQFGGGFPNDD